MRNVYLSLAFVIVLTGFSLALHLKKSVWKKNVKEFEQIFFSDSGCVLVLDTTLKRHEIFLPEGIEEDSLPKAFLARLLDGIGYVDDFGIDRRTIEEEGNFKILSLYSRKKNGFHLRIKYQKRDGCLEIIQVEGLQEIFADVCLEGKSDVTSQ